MQEFYKTLTEMVFGSHLYGLQTPESDRDYKGIFLPSPREILLQEGIQNHKFSSGDSNSRNTSEDVDRDFYSLHKFIRMALSGETVALDMLHAPEDALVSNSEIWRELQANRQKFHTSEMKAFMGYVRRQVDKYGVKGSRVNAIQNAYHAAQYINSMNSKRKLLGEFSELLPVDHKYLCFTKHHTKNGDIQQFYEVCGKKYQFTLSIEQFLAKMEAKYNEIGDRAAKAAQNQGIDWKAVTHALRAAYQVRSIFRHGDFEFPLEETDFLLEIKNRELDFKNVVEPELNRVVDEVNELAEKSNLPKKPDTKWAENFLLEVYNQELNLQGVTK